LLSSGIGIAVTVFLGLESEPTFLKFSLVAPHNGQTQLAGTFSHFVPASIPASGIPVASP